MTVNRKKLIIYSFSLWGGLILIFILIFFVFKKNDESEIQKIIEEDTQQIPSMIPHNPKISDFYLFPPSRIYNSDNDYILNDFFKDTINSEEQKVQSIISKQKIFNQNDVIIQELFRKITTVSD